MGRDTSIAGWRTDRGHFYMEMALGERYINIEEKKRARELFETAVDRNPRLGPAIEHLAALLLEDGETTRVVELLEPVYANVQDRYEVLALLGDAYYREKEYGKSVELLEKAVALRRPDIRLLNALAMSHYYTDHFERARELFERSLSMDSEQPRIKELLAQIKSESPPR